MKFWSSTVLHFRRQLPVSTAPTRAATSNFQQQSTELSQPRIANFVQTAASILSDTANMTGILNKVGSFIHNNLNFDNSNNDFGSYTDPYLDVNSDIWNSGQTEPHNLSSNLTSALEPINYNRLSQYDELATSHAYPRTSNHAVSHTAHPAVPQVSSHILSRAASHTTPYEGAHAAQQAPPAASEYSGDNNQHINLDYLNNEFNYSNYLQPSASMMAQAGQMQSPRFLQNNNFHSNNFNNFFPQTPMNAPSKSPNAFDLGLPNVDVPIANKPTAFLRTPPSDSDATIENKKVNATSTQIKNVASRSRREKKQVPHMAHIECGITETVNEKTKKAKMVIEQQQLAVTEAGKMGQYATITYNNGGRAVIGGALWYAQGYDPTIPVTQDDEDALFTKMLAAISNNQNCSHSSTSNVFKNRWGNEAKYYTQIELEDAAWDIIQEIKKVHTDGWTYKIRDKHLRETIQETMFWSFQDRFDGVVELLRVTLQQTFHLLFTNILPAFQDILRCPHERRAGLHHHR